MVQCEDIEENTRSDIEEHHEYKKIEDMEGQAESVIVQNSRVLEDLIEQETDSSKVREASKENREDATNGKFDDLSVDSPQAEHMIVSGVAHIDEQTFEDLNNDDVTSNAQEDMEDNINLVLDASNEQPDSNLEDESEGAEINETPAEDVGTDKNSEKIEFLDDPKDVDEKSNHSFEETDKDDKTEKGIDEQIPPSDNFNDIQESTDKVDDIGTSEPFEDTLRKRQAVTSGNSDEIEAKKLKLDTVDIKPTKEQLLLIDSGTNMLSKAELEKFVSETFISEMTKRSDIAKVKQELVKAKLQVEAYKKKCNSLSKQLVDLKNIVDQVADANNSAAKALKPKSIVRHVAVQVPSKNMSTSPQPEKKVKTLSPANRLNPIKLIGDKMSPKPAVAKKLPLPIIGRQMVMTKTASTCTVTTTPRTIKLASTATTVRPILKAGESARVIESRPAVTSQVSGSITSQTVQFVQGNNRYMIPSTASLTSGQTNQQPVAYLIANAKGNPGPFVVQSGSLLINSTSSSTANSTQASRNNVLGNRPFIPQSTQNPMVMRQANGVRKYPSHPVRTLTHPAPLPPVPIVPNRPGWKSIPPKPNLKIQAATKGGIMLSWNLHSQTKDHEEIKSYQIYAYQETSDEPSTRLWKTVGDVKALALPMACTLTQFKDGFKYHFAVRAVDIRNRMGPSSDTGCIELGPPRQM